MTSLPEVSSLTMLTTLNLAVNSLEGELDIPGLEQCDKLSVVDVSGNNLTSLGSLQSGKFPHLFEVVANHNQLEYLAPDIAENWALIKRSLLDILHS